VKKKKRGGSRCRAVSEEHLRPLLTTPRRRFRNLRPWLSAAVVARTQRGLIILPRRPNKLLHKDESSRYLKKKGKVVHGASILRPRPVRLVRIAAIFPRRLRPSLAVSFPPSVPPICPCLRYRRCCGSQSRSSALFCFSGEQQSSTARHDRAPGFLPVLRPRLAWPSALPVCHSSVHC
jgi:hypothetical protein